MITVRELISVLQDFPEDMIVLLANETGPDAPLENCLTGQYSYRTKEFVSDEDIALIDTEETLDSRLREALLLTSE